VKNRVTSELRLPDFIAVGPPRTGTTWLYRVLSDHVGFPEGIKETHFFSRYYDRGIDRYLWYFRNCAQGVPMGEVDPLNFDSERARERIALHIPNCKIIVTLREPVERAYSHYKTLLKTGEIRRRPFDFDKHRRAVGMSKSYAHHLRGWFEKFGRARVMVMLYDDLKTDPQGYINRICEFIGVAPIDLNNSPFRDDPVNPNLDQPRSYLVAHAFKKLRGMFKKYQWIGLAHKLEVDTPLWRFFWNGGRMFPPLDRDEAARAKAMVRAEVEELEQLVGRDLSAWR